MNSFLPDARDASNLLGLAKPSLEKLAYEQIRENIRNGHFLPGTLLSENEIAEHLGMSRTPIRAAISLLETKDSWNRSGTWCFRKRDLISGVSRHV